jgi:PII-like signaling protein
MKEARRVRVFVGEDERYRGRPLFEAIVLAARGHGLAGATVFKGFMGYAPNADVATAGILRLAENLPVVVDMVDDEERIEGFLPFLRRSVGTGMVISSDVWAEQVAPGIRPERADGTEGGVRGLAPITRARIYLRGSATFEGRPAHGKIASALRAAGVADVSVHHGTMGFDRHSGVLSARPLRFHADLPVVVEAVGGREEIGGALPRVREALQRGLITLAGVELHAPKA